MNVGLEKVFKIFYPWSFIFFLINGATKSNDGITKRKAMSQLRNQIKTKSSPKPIFIKTSVNET